MKLKLDRTSPTFVEVPDKAKFVMDLKIGITTKGVFDPVSQKYRQFSLSIMKVWEKQPDGTWILKMWPCEQLYPDSHPSKKQSPESIEHK